MRWLAIILLLGVFIRHDTSFLASSLTPLTPGSWFTVMGGLWEIVLCMAILRTVPSTPLLTAAMLIGISEGAQISVCRIAITDISAVPPKADLCDYVTGLPIGFLMTFAELGLVVGVIAMNWHSARRS